VFLDNACVFYLAPPLALIFVCVAYRVNVRLELEELLHARLLTEPRRAVERLWSYVVAVPEGRGEKGEEKSDK